VVDSSSVLDFGFPVEDAEQVRRSRRARMSALGSTLLSTGGSLWGECASIPNCYVCFTACVDLCLLPWCMSMFGILMLYLYHYNLSLMGCDTYMGDGYAC